MVRMSDVVRGLVREKAADEAKGSAAPEAPPAPPRTRPVAEVPRPAPPPRVETPPAVEPAASLDALPLEPALPETPAESAEPLFAELQLFLARVREIIRTGDAFPWSELEHLIERCVVSLERSSELFWVANNTIALAGVDYLAFHQARVAALAIAVFKATLVVLFFMHVKDSTRLTWAVVIGSVFWLAILLVLTFSDYLTRAWLTFG